MQARERRLEHLPGFDDLEVPPHDVADPPVLPVLRQGVEDVAAQQHAHHAAVLDDREIRLRAGDDEIEHPPPRVAGRERLEVGQHGAAHRNATQRGAHLHHARLLRRADPDEEGDEQEERIGKQADEAEQ